jgi:hypothetical protein
LGRDPAEQPYPLEQFEAILARNELHHKGEAVRVDERQAASWIPRQAAPVRATPYARKDDRPLQAGRRTGASSSIRPGAGRHCWTSGCCRCLGEREPFPFLQTESNEEHAQFSPDGRWLAYTSDASGRPEIYVQSFPASGGTWRVSTHGGTHPRWRRSDGKELFYLDGRSNTLMAATVNGDSHTFEAAVLVALFDVPVGRISSSPAPRATPSSWRRACAPWSRPVCSRGSQASITWRSPASTSKSRPGYWRCWRRESTG